MNEQNLATTPSFSLHLVPQNDIFFPPSYTVRGVGVLARLKARKIWKQIRNRVAFRALRGQALPVSALIPVTSTSANG